MLSNIVKEENKMVSAILSIIIVNLAYKLFAKLVGADVMYFDVKKKLFAYCFLGVLLFETIGI